MLVAVGYLWSLGFAGGVMNFLWMGLATLMMVLEKLPQLGHFLVKPLGSTTDSKWILALLLLR